MEDLNTLVAQWLAEAGWDESYIALTTKAIIILGILLVAFAVTVVFALAANFSMRPKLDRVNMAESLKSVE